MHASEPSGLHKTAGEILAMLPLLGPAPLIRGEDARSYDELLARICAALQPRDSLEEIWVRDVVDLVWETFRLRRAKAWLITDDARGRVQLKLDQSHPYAAEHIAREWAAGDDDAAAQVTQALASEAGCMDGILARAIWSSFHTSQRLDRALLSVESRRSAALRELDRYRAPLAQQLRRAIAEEERAELVPDAPRIAAPQQPP